MLPTILQHSAELIAFISSFNLVLYQPQMRHLHNLVDAMLVCGGRKTLTNRIKSGVWILYFRYKIFIYKEEKL
jgi:hypothetical protein